MNAVSSSSSWQTASSWWMSDNLGVVAALIPVVGIATMIGTEVLACTHHFDCSQKYPTLSYAAEFKPEGYVFTLGMCTTALLIQASVALYHWFLRLQWQTTGGHSAQQATARHTADYMLGFGTLAALSLFGLAVFDMGAFHDTHIICTVVFFLSAWACMVAMHIARRQMLRDDELVKLTHRAAKRCDMASLPMLLQRWKYWSILDAYRTGRIILGAGLSATGLFGLLFLCVNGVWPNPLGFTAVQEAALEAFAIVCQLLYVGTLCCELSQLTRIVELRDYRELEHAE
ncbi:hypothetical protein PINS_up024270 [Pythium insidiosum]|nr:hypothetical protein PINS_up009255 [Pythium insidiosum]GLE11701.1 hypothetical protein PINS_up024270 [Pythium insidiosum]